MNLLIFERAQKRLNYISMRFSPDKDYWFCRTPVNKTRPCVVNFLKASRQCLKTEDQPSLDITLNMIDAAIDFMCHNSGDRIARKSLIFQPIREDSQFHSKQNNQWKLTRRFFKTKSTNEIKVSVFQRNSNNSNFSVYVRKWVGLCGLPPRRNHEVREQKRARAVWQHHLLQQHSLDRL